MSTQEEAGATVADWEREEIDAANASGGAAGDLRPRAVAAGVELGQLGRGVSRRPATRRCSRAGPTTPRTSRRRRRTLRCSRTRRSARSPTTTPRSAAALERKPALVGHSFGGSARPDPGRARPLGRDGRHRPRALQGRAAAAVLGAEGILRGAEKPGQPPSRRAADLEQFRYGFANAVSEEEAKKLYEEYLGARGRARRCSRRRRRTSTRGPTRKSSSRTLTAGRC